MKKIFYCVLSVFVLCCLMVIQVNAQEKQNKILVAYFSYTGNTQNIANQIKDIVGGDVFRIEPVKDYSDDVQEVLEVSRKEIANNFKPELKEKINNIDQYDIIFVGSPNWYNTIAPPVASFLSEYDLTGKKVVPFVTHGGGGKADCFDDMQKIISGATFLKGIAIYEDNVDSSSQELFDWLKEIQLL